MFKIVSNRIVKDWPATASIATDGGKTEKHDFTVDLKLIDTNKFTELSRQGDAPLVREVLVGWNGIGDESGNPMSFTPDNLTACAQNPAFVQAVFTAYLEASSGRASEKNS